MKSALAVVLLIGAALVPGSLSPAPASADPASDAETIDLRELSVGESRALGGGDEALTVTRTESGFTLTDSDGETKAVSFDCDADDAECRLTLLGTENGPGVLLTLVESQCQSGEEDCMTVDKRVIVLSGVGGAVDARRSIRIRTDAGAQIAERLGGIGRRVFVVGGDAKTIDVDLDLELDALGEDLMLWMSAEDERVRLVCPEGDAVVYVDRDNAERTLYCPVHDVPLERAPARGSVVIERRVDED